MKCRKLKIYAAYDGAEKKVPMIKLQGKWLLDAGFRVGHRIKVIGCEDGKLVVEVDDDDE